VASRRMAVCTWRTRRMPHISATTSRPLCDDSPEPYPLPDRATCAGMPLSNHPGGDLRSFGHQRAVSVMAFVVCKECRTAPAALRGTESWVCAARRRAPNRSSSACAPEWIVEGEPAAPDASHPYRQVRFQGVGLRSCRLQSCTWNRCLVGAMARVEAHRTRGLPLRTHT
jgi:hypothetical protein